MKTESEERSKKVRMNLFLGQRECGGALPPCLSACAAVRAVQFWFYFFFLRFK